MERRLTTILAADVVGFSRLMGNSEAGTLARLKKLRVELIEKQFPEHQGRIVKLTGDGILAEFPSVVNAVACAAEWQRAISPNESIQFRIGVNLDDVMIEGDDIYGEGVNVAARLESIAARGGIAVSEAVREQIGNRLDLLFEDMGEQSLKNIARPIRVYSVLFENAVSESVEPTKEARPAITVLPFNNMSGDPD
jgi:adenylate cyclase